MDTNRSKFSEVLRPRRTTHLVRKGAIKSGVTHTIKQINITKLLRIISSQFLRACVLLDLRQLVPGVGRFRPPSQHPVPKYSSYNYLFGLPSAGQHVNSGFTQLGPLADGPSCLPTTVTRPTIQTRSFLQCKNTRENTNRLL